ncbi:hypothetical protein M8818_004055 [Zalaria obscura]|uniref:Uncharacterized protein n=1 Tax=Zalaria obscura TaxID=2024903 RepID=A0ACC3SD63_9PEZI
MPASDHYEDGTLVTLYLSPWIVHELQWNGRMSRSFEEMTERKHMASKMRGRETSILAQSQIEPWKVSIVVTDLKRNFGQGETPLTACG